MKPEEVKSIAQSLFGESRNPFGAFSLGSETHHAVTIPDAVRRCRWIAIDLNAAAFGLFFVSRSMERERLVPCFDSDYPQMSMPTKFVSGSDGEEKARHAHMSTLPCWWSSDEFAASALAFKALDCAIETAELVPGTSGIAFPVYAERGQCGLAVFYGPEIALPADQLHEIHARCFSLFNAVARIKPGEIGVAPPISKRELECLKLTANGYTSEEIARLLKLSVHTANQYLTNTAQKLNAVNRMHAVAKALRMGLIE